MVSCYRSEEIVEYMENKKYTKNSYLLLFIFLITQVKDQWEFQIFNDFNQNKTASEKKWDIHFLGFIIQKKVL